MKPSELLQQSHDRLKKHHWVKGWGSWKSDTGATCTMGALNWAARKHNISLDESKEGPYQSAVNYLYDQLPPESKPPAGSRVAYKGGILISNNDAYNTEKADILALFQRAIKKAQQCEALKNAKTKSKKPSRARSVPVRRTRVSKPRA